MDMGLLKGPCDSGLHKAVCVSLRQKRISKIRRVKMEWGKAVVFLELSFSQLSRYVEIIDNIHEEQTWKRGKIHACNGSSCVYICILFKI